MYVSIAQGMQIRKPVKFQLYTPVAVVKQIRIQVLDQVWFSTFHSSFEKRIFTETNNVLHHYSNNQFHYLFFEGW